MQEKLEKSIVFINVAVNLRKSKNIKYQVWNSIILWIGELCCCEIQIQKNCQIQMKQRGSGHFQKMGINGTFRSLWTKDLLKGACEG